MEHRPTARRRAATRGRWLGLGVVVTVLCSVLAPSAPAGAQGSPTTAAVGDPRTPTERERAERILAETLELAPDDVPPSPDDRFVDVVETKQAVADAAGVRLAAEQAAADADRKAFQAATALADARDQADAATGTRDDASTVLSDERERLSDLTVKAYVTGGDLDAAHLAALVEGDTSDPGTGRKVIFEQVLTRQEEVTDQARTALSKARKALTVARRKLSLAKQASAERTAIAGRRAAERDAAVDAHDAAIADAQAAALRLRSGSVVGLVPQEVALIGLPRLSAEDLAGWFATSPYTPRVATPIEDYARWFIEEGAAEGIRGDIAFAQAVLETGGFANQDSVVANNFSGIGHCDLCPSGWTFPTPRLGVRAQIQLLKSYAIRKPEYVYDLVDSRLRGPAGCCETWGDLTTVWATDPGYGPKVMLIYTSMVQYALQRRAAGLGFDDAPVGIPAE